MAISEDTAAIVAANLTVAWASRVGQASYDEAGQVGPTLIGVYEKMLEAVQGAPADIDGYIADQKR